MIKSKQKLTIFQSLKDGDKMTLYEIIQNAKTGVEVEHNDLIYALVAMDHLTTIDSMMFLSELRGSPEAEKSHAWPMYERRHNRFNNAMNRHPKEFLGADDDPLDPVVQERVKASVVFADRFFARKGLKRNEETEEA